MTTVNSLLSETNITTPVVLTILCSLCLLYLFMRRKRCNVPSPPGLPILGNALQMTRNPAGKMHLFTHELANKYGEIACVRVGTKHMVWLNSYKMINEAFTRQADIFSYRPKVIRKNIGIVWGNGPEWKRVRRFSLQTMRDFGVGKKTVEERILEEVSNVLKLLEESKGEPVDIKQMMTIAVSNTIHSVAFGFRYEQNNAKFKAILDDLDIIFSTTSSTLFLLMQWLRRFVPGERKKLSNINAAQERIKTYITQQIEDHKVTFDENNIRDFVDIYIKSEKNANRDDNIPAEWLFESIRSLFNAGTDTTATTLQWAFLFMLKYPDVQKKCQEAIDKHVGSGRMVTQSDRSNLTYIDATINEIQRLGNIAISSVPHMNNKDANLFGYDIPKGSTIFANVYHLHMSPENWTDPTQFMPERFLSDDGKLLKKENFIPFGSGSRVCPGESLARTEIFLMLSNALQRFTVKMVDPNDKLSLEGIQGVTLSPRSYKLRAYLR